MSSPSLHLSSQALPASKSRPATPALSSSNSEALEFLLPQPASGRDDQVCILHKGTSVLLLPQEHDGNPLEMGILRLVPSRHRVTNSPPLISHPSTSSPSPPNAHNKFISSSHSSLSPEPSTPNRRNHDLPSPPDTPTPLSKSRSQLHRASSRRAAASAGHLPLNTPDTSSSTPGTSSPVRIRSSTRSKTPLSVF